MGGASCSWCLGGSGGRSCYGIRDGETLSGRNDGCNIYWRRACVLQVGGDYAPLPIGDCRRAQSPRGLSAVSCHRLQCLSYQIEFCPFISPDPEDIFQGARPELQHFLAIKTNIRAISLGIRNWASRCVGGFQNLAIKLAPCVAIGKIRRYLSCNLYYGTQNRKATNSRDRTESR